jgi:hypothetical protein
VDSQAIGKALSASRLFLLLILFAFSCRGALYSSVSNAGAPFFAAIKGDRPTAKITKKKRRNRQGAQQMPTGRERERKRKMSASVD